MRCSASKRSFLTLLATLAVACGKGESPTDTPDPPAPVATTVQLSTASVAFDAFGETQQVNANVLDQNGGAMTSATVSWTSSADGVASVSPTGLITAVGNGTATITATSGNASANVGAAVEQVVTALALAPDPLVLNGPGATAPVTAAAQDANGNAATEATIAWSTSDDGVATVSDAGFVTGVAGGSAVISASADATIASIDVFVGGETILISGTQPPVLIEGGAATITGSGFAGTPSLNTVTIGGLAATVTGASTTALTVIVPTADCLPPRVVGLQVATPTDASATTVDVTPSAVLDLDLGGGVFEVENCVHLAGATGTERYLIGALSTSETPSSLTPFTLGASAASTAPAPAAVVLSETEHSLRFPVSAGPVATRTRSFGGGAGVQPPLDRSGEARIRMAERELLERLLRSGARLQRSARTDGPRPISPNVGDTVSLNVPAFPPSCESATTVEAVARWVGTTATWLEDIDNPTGSFTPAEYQAFDQTLSAATLPTLQSYFGDFADVDGNGRMLVLLTKEVNKQENLAGFVWGGDLFDVSQCSTSNRAEMFYGVVPDPAGVHGRIVEKAQILPTYDALVAHETTHILQFTQALLGAGTLKATWELEGGATLSEQLVGYGVLGHGSRQDLGLTEYQMGVPNGWYRDWANDMSFYFGRQSGGARALGAPEQCSWVGRESEGNSGPCENGRAPYGVPATLLRQVLDWYGPDHAGGEAGLMRELTSSTFRGFETLEEATGQPKERILAEFGIALWADGWLADWLPSWDIFDVFQGFPANAQLLTYQSTAVEPQLTASVRAGSNAYLEWSPPSGHEATSLRIRTPGGQPLPDHMVLWVLRIQ